MANDLLLSRMKKAGKNILWLLMLIWKNYGGGKKIMIMNFRGFLILLFCAQQITANGKLHE